MRHQTDTDPSQRALPTDPKHGDGEGNGNGADGDALVGPVPRVSGRTPLALRPAAYLVANGLSLALGVFVAEASASAAGLPPAPRILLLGFPILTLLLLSRRPIESGHGPHEFLESVRSIVTTTAVAAILVLAAAVTFSPDADLAQQVTRYWLFSAAALVLGRLPLDYMRLKAWERGFGRRTLIVGAGQVGQLVARRLARLPQAGLVPVGFLDKDPLPNQDGEGLPPVLGASWDLGTIVREHRIEHVIVAFSTAPTHVLLELVRRCLDFGLTVSTVPRLYERLQGHVVVEYFGGLPIVGVTPADPAGWRFRLKYVADRVVGAVVLVGILPVYAVLAAAVWVSVGRPIFFRQQRVGLHGRTFDMLKFRSMRGTLAHDEDADGRELAGLGIAPGGIEGADRRTRFGAFLRRTSLDELPQLVNVLRGEMSVVGPRPERPAYADLFEQSVPRYSDRYRVKAGITGWAQINGLRGRTSLEERIEWDNFYIENWSPWLDFKILLLTLLAPFWRAE
jgi:exopolysaccharide biosynthesis polyprenyl glycosylphosphotransferase